MVQYLVITLLGIMKYQLTYLGGRLSELDSMQKGRSSKYFSSQVIQSDHGPEFSKWFTKVIKHKGVRHRHSRVRRPTDNGHIERFIRTLQQECLSRVYPSLRIWRKEIPAYLYYYNNAMFNLRC